MIPQRNNIGAYINAVTGIKPTNATTTVNGTGVDRLAYGSATLFAAVGAASGSPSAQSVTYKLQDSADDSTYADISTETSALAAMTADNATGQLDIDLTGLRQYVRVVATVSLTGGTSPAIPIAATLVLGGASVLPV